MHNITPKSQHAIITAHLAMHHSVSHCTGTIVDGLNEMLRNAVDAKFLADYAFLNSDAPDIAVSSVEPTEGELFNTPFLPNLKDNTYSVLLTPPQWQQVAQNVSQWEFPFHVDRLSSNNIQITVDIRYFKELQTQTTSLDTPILAPQLLPNAGTPEEYKCICISTGHLTDTDRAALTALTDDPDCNMVMKRDYGWFIKLYSEQNISEDYGHMSESFQLIIRQAINHGYCLIEFDCDASTYSSLPYYE